MQFWGFSEVLSLVISCFEMFVNVMRRSLTLSCSEIFEAFLKI